MYEVVILDGGLGNNLFQLHHAWGLKLKHDSARVVLHEPNAKPSSEKQFLEAVARELGLEISTENTVPSEVAIRIARAKRSLSERGLFPHWRSALTVTQLPTYRLHCGYWQTIPFVAKTKNQFDDTVSALLEDGCSDVPILHIRGGDYLSPMNARIYSILDSEYYREAFEEVERLHEKVTYEVVTNDPAHVTRMLSDEQGAFDLSVGKTVMEDFSEISRHKVIVATNSTFCWWAARIGLYKGQTELIIAPRHWMKEGYRHRSHPKYCDEAERVVLKT